MTDQDIFADADQMIAESEAAHTALSALFDGLTSAEIEQAIQEAQEREIYDRFAIVHYVFDAMGKGA